MVMFVMRAARRRWAIENETFQTPKARDGYNFGHGNNHPADVFATLAMLAFLIDQVQQHCCPLFGKARQTPSRPSPKPRCPGNCPAISHACADRPLIAARP